MTYMNMFEDNKKVSSVRLGPPEAIFWRRGQMVGKKWAISENHHIFYLAVALEPSSATEVSQRTFSLCIKLKTASFQ